MRRTLPRTPSSTNRRARWVAAALATLMLATGPAALSHADDLKDKRNKVQKSVKSASGDLEESSRAMYTATANLRAAKTQLLAAQRRLAKTQGELTTARILDAQMQAKLVAAVAALKEAQRELAAGKIAVVEQRKAVGRQAVEAFQLGDPELLRMAVLLRGESPEDIAAQLGAVESARMSEEASLSGLQVQETLLNVQRQKVEAAKVIVAEQRQEAAVNLARKQALEKEAVTNRAQIASLVNARASAARLAQAARLSDKRKLLNLRKEEARIQRLIIERARTQKGGFSGSSNGFLVRPVDGEVTSPYGYRRHPIYGYYGLHDGVDFRAPCGTPMRAGSGGTVISEYYSDVWGNRLVLDVGRVNGRSMTLIYNHISSYRARTGERVTRGETVAYSGNTGWSTACHLHFTVMINGSTVDPMRFF